MLQDGWDAETIVSTYSNTENHPGMINVRARATAVRMVMVLCVVSMVLPATTQLVSPPVDACI